MARPAHGRDARVRRSPASRAVRAVSLRRTRGTLLARRTGARPGWAAYSRGGAAQHRRDAPDAVGQTGPGIAALRAAPGIRDDLGLSALCAGSRADTGRARSACARAGPPGARHGGGVAWEARV